MESTPHLHPVEASISATESPLLSLLDQLGLAYTLHRHRPVFTVAESQDLRGTIPGGHSKNLFVRDKKKNRGLIVAQESAVLDLKSLAPRIGMGRLSFGSAESLQAMLGVTPGSVTPFALINAPAGNGASPLTLVLDADLLAHKLVNFHPLHNAATLSLTPESLLAFVRHLGYDPLIIPLSAKT